jgi:hypothetical protein
VANSGHQHTKRHAPAGVSVMMQHMGRLRPEEVWAARCIESALDGVTVEQHDDGRENAMHDLTLVRHGDVFGACEVTAAADRTAIETWNVAHGDQGRWVVSGLRGGWLLTLDPRCKIRALRQEAPDLLRRLEETPSEEVAVRGLQQLGVVDARQGPTSFPGSVYITIQRPSEFTGGMVADNGDPLVEWFDRWVREPQQRHNLDKLAKAHPLETHLFVAFPGFASAPFTVAHLLMRDAPPLPKAAPRLPDGLTHVWLTSFWTTGAIYHWSGTQWALYPKALP